jgi:FkbM family methyltransferase
MDIEDIRQQFRDGKLSKADYIEAMYKQFHSVLYGYQDYLEATDIERIEISKDEVVFTAATSGIKMLGLRADRRIAPIEILNFGRYEPEETDLLLKMLKPNSVIFDVGANAGWISILLSKKILNSVVYAFEPIQSTYRLLCRNVELNNCRNISCFNYGLSDCEQEIDFYYSSLGSGAASLRPVLNEEDNEKVTSKVYRLDALPSKVDRSVDFIKCDVEGAELLVFRGGIKLLERDKPIIFAEMLRKWSAKYGYHPNDIITLLAGIGYQCFVVFKEGMKIFCSVDENTVETNYFFLHPQKHKEIIDELLCE